MSTENSGVSSFQKTNNSLIRIKHRSIVYCRIRVYIACENASTPHNDITG